MKNTTTSYAAGRSAATHVFDGRMLEAEVGGRNVGRSVTWLATHRATTHTTTRCGHTLRPVAYACNRTNATFLSQGKAVQQFRNAAEVPKVCPPTKTKRVWT